MSNLHVRQEPIITSPYVRSLGFTHILCVRFGFPRSLMF